MIVYIIAERNARELMASCLIVEIEKGKAGCQSKLNTTEGNSSMKRRRLVRPLVAIIPEKAGIE